ncbi:hypothetical protein SBI_02942 [Streptomyces bingchenggensis BCW-1]|uniref:Lipoprotein n=1 Tax=Streptomyces bingchenggensis (strain BCW-1) TaxID=749414 RepID=D7C4L2_STRBB|nr:MULTISPECIES: hypothetical protein [Streptomyces]ADI06063.1 hypothetical protein SBI_02942 [Streptomyces bingchenggensis BCW-1]
MKRLSRLGLAAVAAVSLTGCGVRQSDVIEAGGPATVTVFPDAEQRVLLFFVSSEGRLTPVSGGVFMDRKGEYDGKVPGEVALMMLLGGPSATARAAGLHTELPRSAGHIGMKSGTDQVSVRVPIAVRGLGKTAVRQLVCTAAYAEGGDGTAEVTVAGDDGRLPAMHCDA